MGKIYTQKPVFLFCGLLWREDARIGEAKEILKERFGNSLLESEVVDFLHSHYYESEMGKAIKRSFVSFKEPIFPDQLAAIKSECNQIENSLALSGNRTVNIDPGYVDLPKVVLASTKDFSHRIPIGEGIFAEVTLNWRMKTGYENMPWTYPDYKTDYAKTFFKKIRDYYKDSHITQNTHGGLHGTPAVV